MKKKKKRLYMASVSLQIADPRLELTRKVLQLAIESGKGPALLIPEPPYTLSVGQIGLQDL